VIVEIATRDPDGIGDVGKRTVLETLPIEQLVSRFNDLIAF
jgi:hypothetical protein